MAKNMGLMFYAFYFIYLVLSHFLFYFSKYKFVPTSSQRVNNYVKSKKHSVWGNFISSFFLSVFKLKLFCDTHREHCGVFGCWLPTYHLQPTLSPLHPRDALDVCNYNAYTSGTVHPDWLYCNQERW